MGLTGAAAVALAAALDAAVAEPPEPAHPVALFGRAVAPLEGVRSRPGLVGAAAALVLPLVAAAAAGAATWLAGLVHPAAGAAAAGLTLFAATSLRMLLGEARAVLSRSVEDLPAARERLRSLAGRDATDLSAGQVRSAAVESLAENLADGLVAPLVAFALAAPLSLPLAAGAAAWVKAVNTMDSMVGYPDEPVGRAAARLDDLVMYVPARATAALLAAAAANPGALAVRAGARRPASPNSGWPMATMAAALDVRLAKPGAYELNPVGALPSPEDGARAVAVTRRAGLLAYALAGVIAWA